ncbi:MAG: type II toxin-antitoxin system VapC family toxin [Planctomycetota bacterium]
MIFVDTGAFLARYLGRDQHHARAVKAWRRVGTTSPPLATSNFVLDETFTLLGRWAGYAFAAERARALLHSDLLRILRPGEQEELDAIDLFEKYADQQASFTDCISFVLMRKHAIELAFTFDRDFRAAGFRLWPP